MGLSGRDLILTADTGDRSARGPGSFIRPQGEGVVTLPLRDVAARPPAVAERDRHGVRRQAWDDPGRSALHASVDRHVDEIAVAQALLRGQSRAERDHIIPGDLGERLRQLLQPGNIGKPSIPHGRIGGKEDFELVVRCRVRRHRGYLCGDSARRPGRSLDEAVMQGLPPAALEIATEVRLPRRAHRGVGGRVACAQQQLDELVDVARGIKRRNDGLNDCGRAVDGTGVAPALQTM